MVRLLEFLVKQTELVSRIASILLLWQIQKVAAELYLLVVFTVVALTITQEAAGLAESLVGSKQVVQRIE